MRMKKRGQITLFIIIAIVLLFASALFFYFRNNQTEQKMNTEVSQVIVVPDEIKPIKTFIDNCVETTLEDGLTKIGMQAGWVDIDSRFEKPIQGFRSGDLLEVVPNFYIPYWYNQKNGINYIDNAPSLLIQNYIPDDYSMQRQLADYIATNISDCFNDFQNFVGMGYSFEEQGDLGVYLSFNDEDITAEIEYPLKISKSGKDLEISSFSASSPIRLAKIYGLASDIMIHEIALNSFETLTLNNIMPSYEAIRDDYLPPREGGDKDESCSDKQMWNVGDAETLFNQMLNDNIPLVRYNNTRFTKIKVSKTEYPDPIEALSLRNFFDGLIIDATRENYSDFVVTVTPYPTNIFLINGQIGPGGILMPTSSIDISSMFTPNQCKNGYNYKYSFEYPVLINIEDKKLGHEYNFQFPMLIVVRDNAPRYSLMNPPAINNYSDNNITAHLNDLDCDSNQAQSDPITIEFKDAKIEANSNLLDGAIVDYQCTPIGLFCSVGIAKKNESGNVLLTSNFPICHGGMLRITNPKYMDAYRGFSTDEGFIPGYVPTFDIVPLKTLEVGLISYVTKITTYPDNTEYCEITSEIASLNESHKVSIQISRIAKDGNFILAYVPTFNGNDKTQVALGPGNYTAQIMLSYNYPENAPRVIPAFSESIGGITLPNKDMEIRSTFVGGALVNFTVKEDYMQKSKIMFQSTNEGEPKGIMDLNAPLKHLQICPGTLLQPRIS